MAATATMNRISTRVEELFGRLTATIQTNARTKGSSLERFLSACESHCVSIQRILLWDNPTASAVALVLFNILYWMLVSWSRRFLSIISLAALFGVSYHAWVAYIWPEIRVPLPDDKDQEEEWLQVHPLVLSAPEIHGLVCNLRMVTRRAARSLIALRTRNHKLFCLVLTSFFLTLAIVGRLIPGVLIVYFITMSVSLGPGIVLYVLPKILRDRLCEALFNQDQYTSDDRDLNPNDPATDNYTVSAEETIPCTQESSEPLNINRGFNLMGDQIRQLISNCASSLSGSPPSEHALDDDTMTPPAVPKVPASSPAEENLEYGGDGTNLPTSSSSAPHQLAEMTTEAADKIIQFVRDHFNGSSGSVGDSSASRSPPHISPSPPSGSQHSGGSSPPINEDEYEFVSEGELNSSPMRRINHQSDL